MSPIFYHNALSPPSRAALLVIRNLELNIEVKIIDTYKDEQNTPEYLKINPLHQVPAYVDGDFILTESRAIASYLASTAQKLYPTELKKRALVDSRLYFDATNSFPALRDFARPVLRSGIKKITQDRRDAIKALVNSLELLLKKSKWFSGDELTIADLSILSNVTTIKTWGVSFVEFPKLNDWYGRCKSLPGFLENQEGAQLLSDKLIHLLDEPLWT